MTDRCSAHLHTAAVARVYIWRYIYLSGRRFYLRVDSAMLSVTFTANTGESAGSNHPGAITKAAFLSCTDRLTPARSLYSRSMRLSSHVMKTESAVGVRTSSRKELITSVAGKRMRVRVEASYISIHHITSRSVS